MASEYDALLEEAPQIAAPSEYDELLVSDTTPSPTVTPDPAKPRTLRESLGRFLGGAKDLGTEILSEFSPDLSARVFGQTSGSLREEEKSKPLISPELAKNIVGELPAYAGGNTGIGRGIAEGTASALSGFSSPAALGQLPAFAIPGVAETYALNIAAGIPKQAEELGKVAGESGMLSQEFGKAATEAAIVDLTGAAAGLHSPAVKSARLSESLRSILEPDAALREPAMSDRLPETTLSPEVIAETKPVAEPVIEAPVVETPAVEKASIQDRLAAAQRDMRAAQASGDAEALARANESIGAIAEEMMAPSKAATAVANENVTVNPEINPVREVTDQTVLHPEDTEMVKKSAESLGLTFDRAFEDAEGNQRIQVTDTRPGREDTYQIPAGETVSDLKTRIAEKDAQYATAAEQAAGGATMGSKNGQVAQNAVGSDVTGAEAPTVPDAATASVGPGAASISEAQVPAHLRSSPEIAELLKPADPIPVQAGKLKLKANKEGGFVNMDLLNEAAQFGARVFEKAKDFTVWSAQMISHLGEHIKVHLKTIWDSVTGADFLLGSTEGGAIFSGGGKRKAKAVGLTPKGNAEFIKIEPAWKRAFKGLERKGAADVIGETKNPVGKALANATKRHVDVEQELFGQLSTPLLKTTKGLSRSASDKAFGEVSKYFADKENGRTLPALSPTAQKLVTEWENIAEKTGQIATANNVQVFDPATGGYRPMHTMGKDYVPRMIKPEVERVMRDPDSNPKLWNDLVDDFATQRGIPTDEAANALRAESGRFSSSDFMGSLEMARTGKMPESFYDYDMRSLASRYIPAFTERMSQIISYGQRLGPREAPLRENLWDVARKEASDSYTQEYLMNAEDQAVNMKGRGAAAKGMARAQTIGSGLLLSSPTTTVARNLLSGVSATPELLGIGRSIRTLVDTAKSSQARMDAREIGAVRDNMGDFLHVDRLGESFVDDAIRSTVDAALKYSGYNGSEVFVRSHGALTASQFAKDGVAEIAKNPASMRSKEALALFKRMGSDPEKIVAEGADWKTGPETRKFIRTVIRETQGGYRFDQVPLWANSNMGRFFYQFGRWGTQRARNIWNNGIKPALGEEVQWKGKTMNRRDVRPLLKMLGTTVVLGETFAGIAQLLFGRDRRDASVSEINAAWQDDDQKKAVALAMERMVNDVIMAGTLGIWSQPIDWAKGFKNQSRLKNPSEPPGLGSVKALMELGRDAIDQDGRLTRKDLISFAASAAPGVKQVTDVARNVFDEPLYEAENDVRTLRGAAQRWARQSGLSVSPSAKGDFRKSAMAPEYEPIKDALLVGDTERASFLSAKFLDAQPNRDKALQNLKASVKQSQPFRVGPYTAEQHRNDFMIWAEHNLSKEDLNQAQRIQERYMRAAQDVNLW